MPPIRILPDRIANQIAAGEVIERPVAVVKELIENSIDAGATRIEVEFRKGGKSYIRVEDNGSGMPPDEASMALERHATSKIRESRDLAAIGSFGFRGEALPSIASVAKFTLRTRAEGWNQGTEIRVNGGKLLEKKACGMPVGTVIEVAHLFNAVPARRKFLKTEPTETAHITYAARLFAVAHPHIAFRVLENERTVFQSPVCNTLAERIAEIWGRRLADDLMPVEASDTDRNYRLTGLTAKPGVGRSTRREMVTLVNKRPVDSRTLGFAILDAYHGRIQKGRYPPAFLFLEVPHGEVDVNVHPAKREVRFRDDGSIRRFVLEAVSATLAEAPLPGNTATSGERGELPSHRPSSPTTPPQQEETEKPRQPTHNETPLAPLREARIHTLSPVTASARQTSETDPPTPAATRKNREEGAETEQPSPTRSSAIKGAWRFIDFLKGLYALFEAPQGLFLLHLRHAHQRIVYERLLASLASSEPPPSQPLLIPQPVELEPLAAQALNHHMETINDLGFEPLRLGWSRNRPRPSSVILSICCGSGTVRARNPPFRMRRSPGSPRGKATDAATSSARQRPERFWSSFWNAGHPTRPLSENRHFTKPLGRSGNDVSVTPNPVGIGKRKIRHGRASDHIRVLSRACALQSRA